MSFTHVTLAKDLSLSSPGFAVLAVTEDGEPLILDKSHVKTTSYNVHGHRLLMIDDEIRRLIKEYKPSHVVREKGFSRFPRTTQALFKVVGCSDRTTFEMTGLEVVEIAPTSVKKIVTGDGKSTKKDVEKAVIERLRIEQDGFFETDDESDAAAVGLAFLIKEGVVN